MEKEEKKKTLRDAILEYGDYKDFVFIHRYGVPGYFKYETMELSEKMLSSELILVRMHTGGTEYNYDAITYIIK